MISPKLLGWVWQGLEVKPHKQITMRTWDPIRSEKPNKYLFALYAETYGSVRKTPPPLGPGLGSRGLLSGVTTLGGGLGESYGGVLLGSPLGGPWVSPLGGSSGGVLRGSPSGSAF